MSLLLVIGMSLLAGAVEWYLALRRTLACVRGETLTLVVIVALENGLGFTVTYLFVKTDAWPVALAYTVGAAISTYLTMKTEVKKNESK
jgi:hypothetical protein